MRSLERSGTFQLGDLRVRRLGCGAMHLSGAGIFGPPQDRDAASAVLRETVAAGVDHIDTRDRCEQIRCNHLHVLRDDLYRLTGHLRSKLTDLSAPSRGLAGVAVRSDS
jgi:pyridoxine 4-dehydrogenase